MQNQQLLDAIEPPPYNENNRLIHQSEQPLKCVPNPIARGVVGSRMSQTFFSLPQPGDLGQTSQVMQTSPVVLGSPNTWLDSQWLCSGMK